ncbi:transglutaminase family protein [Sphingomonas naphthae]|uniref:Transglutaminase family protein n=1 Tax=Sphingomonas naphthae TaxID=1813468 RepID=A0ABY7TJX5_9SPHN|nr:transglutaminase family protein [Sphingomonas naphthae]WCT73532.1 transglutaminase family protein [Sphingomonas naphthae]
MRYAIRHVTRFKYEAPFRFARCNLRLKPIDWEGQRVEESALEVTPAPLSETPRPAGYLCHVTRILLDKPATELVIESRARLTVDRVAPVADPADLSVAAVAALCRASTDLGVMSPAGYLFPSGGIDLVPAIIDWCTQEFAPTRGIVEAGLALSKRIKAEFRYDGSATQIDTTPAQAFAAKAGVCQDFAQIMISGLRGLGLAAAYVSGYLRTLPPPGKPRLVGADATHAWVLLWCGPARGWLGFDPTNGVTMGADHIVTAIGRDYADVAPIDGVFVGRDGQDIDVSVDVEPLEDAAAAA